MEYEINYLILQSKTSRLNDVRKETKEIIETAGAKVKKEKEFLKRKLAYEIAKERFGFHTVLRIEIDENYQEVLNKIKKKINLSEDVARYVIINAGDLPALEELDYKKEDREEKNPKSEEKKILNKEEAEEILVKSKKEKEMEDKIQQPEDNLGKKQNKDLDKKEAEKEIREKAEKKKEDNIEGDKEKEEGKKDDKVSLDELDEKLDEILNI